MSDARTEAQRRAGKRFLGGLLIACGGMVALLCGACTLVFGAMGLGAMGNNGGFSLVVLALIVGGVPAVVGAFVCWIGVGMFREGSAAPSSAGKAFD